MQDLLKELFSLVNDLWFILKLLKKNAKAEGPLLTNLTSKYLFISLA